MFVMMAGKLRKIAVLMIMFALLAATMLAIPLPASAQGTTDWRCRAQADSAQTLVLAVSDLGRANADRRLFDLDCTFTATAPGPSPVTLCLAVPEGENGGGAIRRLQRRQGRETIEYRLSARIGDVPNALAIPISDLKPALQPLYTVPVGHADTGTVSFRHQFALVTEFGGVGGRFLPEGEYGDTITGLSVSLHEGTDCGFVLWGPPNDSLGSAAEFSTTVRVPATCALSVTDAVDFGVVADTLKGQRENGGISVQCSPGAAYTLELGDGNFASGGTRRMALEGGAAAATDYLAYELLQPDGSAWSGGSSSVTGSALGGTGAGTAQALTVAAQIRPGTEAPRPGRYHDTVVVRLNY